MTSPDRLIAIVLLSAALGAGASPIPWRAYQGPDVGGRMLALSGSIAAVEEDVALAYWNPAAIGFMKWHAASATYTHSQAALSSPLSSGPKRLTYLAFTGPQGGFSWRSLARHREETATAEGADTLHRYLKYSVDEFCLAFANTDESYPGLSLGIAAKLLWARLVDQAQTQGGAGFGRAELLDESGIGYGIDAGLMWRAEPVSIYAHFHNLLAKVYFGGAGEDDKPKIRASGGVGWGKPGRPALAIGAEKYLFDGSPRLRYTASVEYKRSIENFGALTGRAGYAACHKGPADDVSWSWGLGYIFSKFIVDMAALNHRVPGSLGWETTYAASVSLFMN